MPTQFLDSADLRSAEALLDAIHRTLAGIVTTTHAGDAFSFYDPEAVTVPEQRFPFCTIVTGDGYDASSNLDRDPAAYRVNLSVIRASYEKRLGPAPRQAVGKDVIETGADYTAADTWLPHPYYAPMHWVCVVNPARPTGSDLAGLLAEGHRLAQRRYDNRRSREPRRGSSE